MGSYVGASYYSNRIDSRSKAAGTHHLVGVPPITVTASMQIAPPPDFWSPPQLFVAAVHSSLLDAFATMAAASGLRIANYSSTAVAKVDEYERDGTCISDIIIKPVITLVSRKDRPRAERILLTAKARSPIFHSVNTRVVIDPEWSFESHVSKSRTTVRATSQKRTSQLSSWSS